MSKNEEYLSYTIPQLLRQRVKTMGERVALREKDFGIWRTITWKRYYEYVGKTAMGLKSVGLGRGDKIALITDNIPEMLFIAIGSHSLGAISAGLYQTSLPHEIAGILNYL